MFALRPGNVVHKVVHGNMAIRGGVESERVVQTAEVNKMLVLGTDRILALTNVAVAEVVDEIVAEHGSVRRDDPFGVVEIEKVGC